MQFERDRRQAANGRHRAAERGVVDAFVVNERDLWAVVARHGERIDDWMHGTGGDEIAPLRVCRTLRDRDWVVLDKPDPERDHLLSDIEGLF